MIRIVRKAYNHQQATQRYHITWLKPNPAWAMDDCQRSKVVGKETLHLHNLSDLCSRYKFPPLASAETACGEEVAGHLSQLFSRYGAPLFCKRDNGGNLNHVAVNEVLEKALVIPINNPPYMAPYNGAIEHTQGEFKNYLRSWEWKADTIKAFGLLVVPRPCTESYTQTLSEGPYRLQRLFWRKPNALSKTPAKIHLRLDKGSGSRDIHPGGKGYDLIGSVAVGGQTVVDKEWIDQNPQSRKSVTQFFFKFVP